MAKGTGSAAGFLRDHQGHEGAAAQCVKNHRSPAARIYSDPVRSALDLIEGLLVEGIRHGHFDYAMTCETGQTAAER